MTNSLFHSEVKLTVCGNAGILLEWVVPGLDQEPWMSDPAFEIDRFVILRSDDPIEPFEPITSNLSGESREFVDEYHDLELDKPYYYKVYFEYIDDTIWTPPGRPSPKSNMVSESLCPPNCSPSNDDFAFDLVSRLLADNPDLQVTDARYIEAPIASDCFHDGIAHG